MVLCNVVDLLLCCAGHVRRILCSQDRLVLEQKLPQSARLT
jgi:hypothetical protein